MTLFNNIDFYSRRRNIPHHYIEKMKYYEFHYTLSDEIERYEKEIESNKEEMSKAKAAENDFSSLENTVQSSIGDLSNYTP